MFNNKLVDWLFDNGVSNFMTSDDNRNIFYERILSRTVKDKICIDIGFGTGMLSFLAIKHGAKHITAFEMNYERYLLGKYLIEKLGFSDKINLLNCKFDASFIPSGCDLIFHEIFDQELWGEGAVYASFNHTLPIIPSRYKADFFLYELDPEQYRQLLQLLTEDSSDVSFEQSFHQSGSTNFDIRQKYSYDFYNKKFIEKGNYLEIESANKIFDPQVEFPNSDIYKKEIQNFLDEFWYLQKNKRIHTVSNLHYRLFRHHQHQDFVNASIKVGSYEIDYQSNTLKTTDKNGNQTYSLDRSKMHIDLDIDAEHFKDKITILLPVTSIGHDELELVCTNLFEFNHPAPPGINRFLSKYGWDIPKKHQMFIDPVQNKESTVHLRQYLDSAVMRFYLK